MRDIVRRAWIPAFAGMTPLFQDVVEAAGAEGVEVEGDPEVTEGLEAGGDFVAVGEGEFHLVGGDLDAAELVVVAGADLAEAEVAQDVLGGFDAAQGLDGYGGAVGDAGGQAGLGGLVPQGYAEPFGGGADLGLVHLGFDHGAADVVLGCGGHAGAIVAEVVGVGAVGDPSVAFGERQGAELVVEFGLAEVAALGRVGDVALALEFVGVDDAVVEVELGGDGLGVGEVAGGEGGGDGGNGQGAATQRALGRHRQEGAVDAAGAGDDDRFHIAEDGLQVR